MYSLKMLFIYILLCMKQQTAFAVEVRKFVYQKDMSEYCRRRVMPSVFLGRQVIDAYSQILHFSRLELPYSCFVSIRTESGSNIILVIQLMSDKSLIESCRDSKNQLLVYEIGETFGGYWGALPDNVMKQESPPDENIYTLKTTQSTTIATTEESTTEPITTPPTTEQSDDSANSTTDKQDYITVEVPLVNVSAKLVPGLLPVDTIFDPEDSFDVMFDVTPWPGVSYKTKVLPLVQFSVANEIGRQTMDYEARDSPRYQLELNADGFTPDSRLMFPLLRLTTKRQRGKYRYDANRRLDFKKNRKYLAQKEALFYKTSLSPFHNPSVLRQPNTKSTKPYDFMQLLSQNETGRPSNSWEIIDAILKNITKNKNDVPNMKIDKDVDNLLQGLAKIGYSDSVYIMPNTSWYTRGTATTTQRVTTKYRTDSITWRPPSASYTTNYFEEVDDSAIVASLSQGANKSSNTMNAMNNNDTVINIDRRSGALLPLTLDIDRVLLNVTNQNNLANIMDKPVVPSSEVSWSSTTPSTPEMLWSSSVKPMTLVDHESWENMVHAASQMAVMLNQSVLSNADKGKFGLNTTLPNLSKRRRKKRYIHAIPIEHAKPHHLPVKIDVPSSTVHSDKISDAQEFQRLIELQDDEIHDRVALRYLRQYVGPALFNICDFDEPAARHVYLFNSSRLVLAITNFTLERMTVVMTPARTLLTSDARCAAAHLECQVSGARVCIDSLSACDGVPNCGSYDIYDEDRLRCGGSAGLQHNVCLAAITFLAVLLTMLYTVHYWLKRCVPKVSDAFFIYTDAAENVLYLDTIMRSPYDTEDPKDIFRDGAITDYMEYTDMQIQTHGVSTFFSSLFRFLSCNRKKRISHDLREIIEDDFDNMHPDEQRIYSFGEVELNKIGSAFVADAAVQTGSSLQMHTRTRINERVQEPKSDELLTQYEGRTSRDTSTIDLELSSNQPSDELSILKFFRRARSVSMQMSHEVELSSMSTHHTEEKEIHCLEYGHDDVSYRVTASGSGTVTVADIIDKKPELVHKKLRFEEAKRIQASDDDPAEEEHVLDKHRRSVLYGGGKSAHPGDMESNNDADEPSTSTNREFKSYFWSSGKNKPKKPTKKKTQLSLR